MKRVFFERIYPEAEDFRRTTKEFFQQEHSEFYEGLTRKRWKTYYEKHIHQAVIIININNQFFSNLTIFIALIARETTPIASRDYGFESP